VRVPVERDHGFRWKMITQSVGTWSRFPADRDRPFRWSWSVWRDGV